MANTLSAQKKNRQRIKNEARNRAQKSEMRRALKKVRSAVALKNKKEASALLKPALRLLARAGRKGLIKQNAASRTVSRLAASVSALSA